MLKKTYFLVSIVLLSLMSFIQPNDRIAHIAVTLEHIAHAKKDILFEVKLALILKHRAEEHFAQLLHDAYESTKQKCIEAISVIVASPEYAITLIEVTNEQVILIVDQLVNYNDLIIDPSVYPLKERVDNELLLAAFEPQIEHFFNALYVPYIIACGSRLLLEKIDLAESRLIAERDSLQVTDEVIQP